MQTTASDSRIARKAHTFRLPPSLLDGLRQAAAEDVRSINNTVELAVRRFLAQRERKPQEPPHGR